MAAGTKRTPHAQAELSPPHRLRLTDQAIARAPALERPYRMWDLKVPGLFVRVQPSGIRSFNVQWSRRASTSIGKFPHRNVEWARNQALKVIADAQDHGTPAAAKAKIKAATFADFLKDRYEPWVAAERKAGKATVANLKAQFGPLFDSKPLTEITAWAIEKFKAKRLKDGTKPATVNRDLDRIRAALNKAVEWEMLPTNPIASVKRSKGGNVERVRYLNADEEQRLRAALAARETRRRKERVSANAHALARGYEPRPIWASDDFTDHLMPLVLLAMNTGLRRGELLSLAWDQVNLERKQLTVAASTAKSGKVRHVPLNSEALSVLKRWRKHRGRSGLVFAGGTGAVMTHIRRSWGGIVGAANLADFHFHDLRHHFASRLVMTGADLYTVKELLGHADFDMTQRYAHLSPEHTAAAVARLNR